MSTAVTGNEGRFSFHAVYNYLCYQHYPEKAPNWRTHCVMTTYVLTSKPHAARCKEIVESIKSKPCGSHTLDFVHENMGLLASIRTTSPEQHKDQRAFRGIG